MDSINVIVFSGDPIIQLYKSKNGQNFRYYSIWDKNIFKFCSQMYFLFVPKFQSKIYLFVQNFVPEFQSKSFVVKSKFWRQIYLAYISKISFKFWSKIYIFCWKSNTEISVENFGQKYICSVENFVPKNQKKTKFSPKIDLVKSPYFG